MAETQPKPKTQELKMAMFPENRKGGKIMESRRDLPEVSIQAHGLIKSYFEDKKEVPVLKGLDLEILNGEIVAVVGPSGAGKSTLLHLLGLMDKPTGGTLSVLGFDAGTVSERKKDELRNKYIGFMFQFHHLISELTIMENTALPLRIQGVNPVQARERAVELLSSVGLKDRLSHLPSEVSGGEQQRAALARAMINRPALLICDEPTGNLDLERGEEIRDLIWRTARAQHATVLIATHNVEIAKAADRTVRIVNGKVADVK